MATSNNIISMRRHDLDNIRTFLTGLVTVHHTALVYGGTGTWPLKSAAFVGQSPLLLGLNVVNQSFFMGLFFWISGRVSAQSLSRTKPWPFVRNKLLRLGVPTVVYTLAIAPAVHLVLLPRLNPQSIGVALQKYYSTLTGAKGPVWYTATLLCFDIAAALMVSLFAHHRTSGRQAFQGRVHEGLRKYGWLVVVACGFLAKNRFPLSSTIPIISLQPIFAFQYIYAYALGYMAYQCDEPRLVGLFNVRNTPVKEDDRKASYSRYSGSMSLTKSFAISLLSLPLIYVPRFLDTPDWPRKTSEQVFGGWNLPSFLYAIWNEFAFALIGPALMSYFERRHNKPAESSTLNARYSYTAFLVHTPVSIALALAVERILFRDTTPSSWVANPVWQALGPVVMTLGVGLPSTWASFFVGKKMLEWIPALKRVI
ncbi:acyltransferase 3 [Xylariales sp. AK1849]|nr:acyltransferase 3 [Xylariales sp. AK1849]